MSWQNCSPCPPCPLVVPVWGHRCVERAQNGTHHIRGSRSETNLLSSGKTSDFGVRWERFANCTLTCRRGTLNHSLDMYVKKIREVAYLPILILLGKLEHEHNPSKPVKSNAKLCRIFPFAFEKLRKSQIPNIYPKVFVSCSHRAHSSNTEAAERTVHPSRAGCCADTRSSRQ